MCRGKLNTRGILAKLALSKSSFYKKKNVQDEKDFEEVKVIKKYYDLSSGKSGIRQLKMEIEIGEGLIINRKKIARLKNKFNLVTAIRKKNTYRKFALKMQEHAILPNLLNRKFKQRLPDRVYSTDITQLYIGKNKGYIAVVKDLCTKEIVASNVSHRIDTKLTNTAIRKALYKLSPQQRRKLLVHSDQGVHFTHESFRKILRKHKVTQSMSRKGNCYDNAPIESFFGHFKDLLDVKECKTISDLEKEVTKKIKYYNYKRPQLGLKKMPPIKYRRHLKV